MSSTRLLRLFLLLVAWRAPAIAQDCWKNFPNRTSMQLHSEWCWAASFQMVCAFYGKEVEQCRIVSAFYGVHACDNPRQGNMPARSMKALKEFMGNNTLLSSTGTSLKFAASYFAGPLTESQIAREVESCRPVLVEIRRGKSGGATHVVVIIGMNGTPGGGHDVVIADPYPYDQRSTQRHGIHVLPYARLRSLWCSTICGIIPD